MNKTDIKNKDSFHFEFAHLGINPTEKKSTVLEAETLKDVFGFQLKEGNSSIFASSAIELIKQNSFGQNGHIGIHTSNIDEAINFLKEKGIDSLPETFKYKDGKLIAAYLDMEIGGFRIHLLQR